jgi:HEAT repeat protein
MAIPQAGNAPAAREVPEAAAGADRRRPASPGKMLSFRYMLLGAGIAAAVLVLAILIVVVPMILGADEVTQKVNDLKSGLPEARAQAVAWLAQTDLSDADRARVAAALEPLVVDADVPRYLNRDAVLRLYLRCADKDNVPAMVLLVENPPPHGWQPKDTGAVMEALGKLKDRRAAGGLAQKLSDPVLHDQAVYALKLIGQGASSAVMNYLFDDDPASRLRASQLLLDFGTRPSSIAAEALRRLRSNQPDVQRGAAAWCAENPPEDEAQKANGSVLLAKLLDDLSPRVNELALRALKFWATKDILPKLTDFARRQRKASDSPDTAACKPALIDVLAQFQDKTAAEAIALQLPDPAQRARAVQGLLKLGPVATEVVLPYLDHPNAEVQKEARSLCRLLKIPADRQLAQTLADLADSTKVRSRLALQRLAGLRADDANRATVSRALNAPLQDPDPSVREDARKAAQVWVTKENIEPLVKNLQDVPRAGRARDGRVIEEVTKLLISLGPDVETKVIPLLSSPDFVVRSQACRILTEVGTPRSVQPLQGAGRLYAGDFNFFNQIQFAIQRIGARR